MRAAAREATKSSALLFDLPHDALDFPGILRSRIVGPQFFWYRLSGIGWFHRELPRDEIDSNPHRREPLPSRMIAPPVIVRFRQPTGRFSNRNRGQKAIIETVPIGRLKIIFDVMRRRAVQCLEESGQPRSTAVRNPWVRRVLHGDGRVRQNVILAKAKNYPHRVRRDERRYPRCRPTPRLSHQWNSTEVLYCVVT